MTQLRQKMIRAMELKNLSSHTQRAYLATVTGIARYYQKSPDKLIKEMVEDYLLYLKNEKGRAPNTCGTALSGLRFFYNNVASEKIPIEYSARKKVRKLPTVLTQEEIRDIINTLDNLKHRLILMTTYSAGLRASEVIALKPDDIDSKRMLIKVEDGKGGKDRYTLLSGYLPAYFLIFSKTPCHNSLISVTPSMYPADKRMTTNTRAVNIEIARLPPSVVESNPDRTVPLKNSRNSPKGILNRNVRR